MASLRNIMNVDADDDQADSRSLKNSAEAGSRLSHHPDSPVVSGTNGPSSSYSMNSSPSRDHRRSPSSHSSHSLPVDQQPSGLPYAPVAQQTPTGRRRSNTSTDSMDSHYGHGHGFGHGPSGSFSNSPMRPFVPPQEVPVKLTPITGRVSRAKKGVPVHTCDVCRPPKTFTRAEHLRRHQLSHQPPDLSCPVAGCDKVFHRRDLLERHQQRHDQDDRMAKPGHASIAGESHSSGGRTPGSIQPKYESTSPTPPSTISMGAAPWSPQVTSLPMHHGNTDIIEHLPDTVATVQSTTPDTSPEFPHARLMDSFRDLTSSSTICSQATTSPASPWSAPPLLTSAPTPAGFSTATVLSAAERRQEVSLSPSAWAAIDHTTSQEIPGSILATSGSYAVPYGYSQPLPQSYSPGYEHEPAVGMAAYDESSSLYGSPIPTLAMRSLSPQLVMGPSSGTLVTAPTPLPADRVVNPMSCRGEPIQRIDLMPTTLSPEVRSALPAYIEKYWTEVHPLYPIIHRPTAEDGAKVDLEHEEVLRSAMGAVAAQFLPHREHRINGSQLHAYAWHKSEMLTQGSTWSLATMQTILLCEYYARFRGRHKDDYQPSARFVALYQMVSDYCHSNPMPEPLGTVSQRWATWISIESCRRLFSACFLLSVHSMCYHEQPYDSVLGMQDATTHKFQVPLSGGTSHLWEARSADLWAALDASRHRVTCVADVMEDPDSFNKDAPAFDVSLVIAAHAVRLPSRRHRQEVEAAKDASQLQTNELVMSKFSGRWPVATAYLALHHTPLHVLLAVSGDSWVFNKKLSNAHLFSEYRKKLAEWRNSGTSAIATVFAARTIRDFLSLPREAAGPEGFVASPHGAEDGKDISVYWGLYVCTLICWAFGHKAGQRAVAADTATTTTEKRLLPARSRAVKWIHAVADSEPGQIEAMPGREDSQAIVSFIRDILEKDCPVGRNILYADSIGVLRKLEEVDNWKWF